MMAVARRLEQSVKIPRGSGAQSFASESYEHHAYRLSGPRVAELQDVFGGGVGDSLHAATVDAMAGISISVLAPSSELVELMGPERDCFGQALKTLKAVRKAKVALSMAGLETARVLLAAYGPRRPAVPGYFATELANVVLLTRAVIERRAEMVRGLIDTRIRRADEAAKRSHELAEGTWGAVIATWGQRKVASNPNHPAQRDIAHARIRRGAEAEVTPQTALASALRKPKNEADPEQRSFTLQSEKQASELLSNASRDYHDVWKSI